MHFLDKYKNSKPSEEQIDKAIDTTLVYIDKGLGVLSTISSFAPVAGVSTAIPILQSIVETIQDVRRNDKARLEVMRNISGLVDLVQSTTLQIKQKLEPVEPSSRPVPTEFDGCIDQLVRDLKQLKRKGKELPNRRFFSKLIHNDDIESVLSDMNKGIADASERFRMKQELIVGLLVENTHQMVRKMERSQSKEEIERVLERLPHADASFRAADRGDYLEGTRIGLLNKLRAWASNTDARRSSRIFVLSGAAGMGKSTLARALARQLHEHRHLGASFFFVRSTAGDLGTTRVVLPTIAYQLANMHDGLRVPIAEAARDFLKDYAKHHLPDQMDKLIINPLKTIPADHPPVVLILDAIDECLRDDIISLLPLLRRLDEVSFPLRVIITTRPEDFILDGLKTSDMGTSIEHFDLKEISVAEVDGDIKQFFLHQFSSLRYGGRLLGARPGAAETLTLRAEQLFIYARTAMQALQNVRTFEVALRRLDSILEGKTHVLGLSTLDSLYLTVLENAYTQSDMEEVSVSHRVQAVLASIVVLQDRVSLDVLTHLLDLSAEDAFETLRELQSVIFFDELDLHAGKIRPLHLTFREFLSDKARCKNNDFYIDTHFYHGRLAVTCLELINSAMHTNMCNLSHPTVFKDDLPDLQSLIHDNIAPHVQYACKYWAIHLSNANVTERLSGALRVFCENKLLVWLEAMSLMSGLDTAVQAFTSSRTWCQGHPLNETLQESSNLLFDGYRLLLEFFEPINQNPEQIYVSALPLAPMCRLVERYACGQRQSGTHCLKLFNTRRPQWDACLRVLEGHHGDVRQVKFSHDGQYIVSVDSSDTMYVWDVSTGLLWKTFHIPRVSSIDCHPHSLYVVSYSYDGVLREWDLLSTSPLLRLAPSPVELQAFDWGSVSYSTESKIMVTLDQQRSGSSTWTVYTWETSGETRILTTSDVVPATIPLLGPPEERNIASSHTYTIQAKLLKRLPCGWAPGVVVSFDMSRFFNSSGDMAGVYELRADINELAPVTIYVHQSSHDAAFSPDGNLVASRTLDQGIILFWDACSGKSVTQYLGHTNLILSLCFSPNNDLLASGSSDGTLRIWDTAIRNSDASDPSVARGHTRPVDFLRISPDGRYAASLSSYEVQVVVWNMADGMIMHTLPVEDSDKYSFFRTVAFNTDSSLLLCAGAGPHCARIWNLESGNVEATFVYAEDEEKGPSLHLAEFSSSGAYIAVGRIYYPYSEHEDGKLHRIDIWDVAEATVISTHQISRSEELHRPLSLTFSRDGRYISLKSLKDNVSCRLDIHNGEEYWEAVSPEPSQGLFKLEDGWITLAESSRKLFWIQSDRRAYYGGEEWGNLMPAFTSLGSLVALGSGIGEVTLLDLSGLLAPQQSS